MLHPEVQKLMGQLEAVRRLAEAQKLGAATTLRVLVVPSLAVVQLPMALRLFRQRHKGVSVSIRTLHSREIAQALALKEADVGIVYGVQAPPGLDAQLLAEQGFGPAVVDSFTASSIGDTYGCAAAADGARCALGPTVRSPNSITHH